MNSDRTERSQVPDTKAYRSERAKLPPELVPIFEDLVEAYRYYAVVHHHHPFVSYKVLAALVRDGWQRVRR